MFNTVHSVAPCPHNRVRRLAWNAAWSGANAAAALGRAVAWQSYSAQAAYSDFFPAFPTAFPAPSRVFIHPFLSLLPSAGAQVTTHEARRSRNH